MLTVVSVVRRCIMQHVLEDQQLQKFCFAMEQTLISVMRMEKHHWIKLERDMIKVRNYEILW